MKNIFFYQTDIGEIGIQENGGAITNVYFSTERISDGIVVSETKLLKEAAEQLRDYLAGKRKVFELPLAPVGTAFMMNVWQALCTIPYGQTRSYREIAQSIGNPKACRAVGMANNKNSIPIFIPCHRVIGANGKLIGYGGGLELKKYLLGLENTEKVK